jgi:hypothetical protein
LLLGHPNHAFSVVLAALLLATGVGSYFSAALVGLVRQRRYLTYLLALLILGLYAFAFPRLAGWITLPFPVRAALVVALTLPIGVLLGTYMPTALEQLKREGGPDWVPWAWGINGIFSVLAPVLSVAFSMTWGIDALFLAAIPLYLAAGILLPELTAAPVGLRVGGEDRSGI